MVLGICLNSPTIVAGDVKMLYGAYYKMRVYLSMPRGVTANVGCYLPRKTSISVYLNQQIYSTIEYQSYFGLNKEY